VTGWRASRKIAQSKGRKQDGERVVEFASNP
jgi:hypothetical protein